MGKNLVGIICTCAALACADNRLYAAETNIDEKVKEEMIERKEANEYMIKATEHSDKKEYSSAIEDYSVAAFIFEGDKNYNKAVCAHRFAAEAAEKTGNLNAAISHYLAMLDISTKTKESLINTEEISEKIDDLIKQKIRRKK